MHSEPSSFAGGRYQVKALLGEGGTKRVYLVRDTSLERDVAFALIKAGVLEEASRSRFVREARVMASLGSHPNIISVYDLGEHDGQPYMVTELVSGGNLEGLLEEAPQHRLAIAQAVGHATAICRALELVHAHGIIHRDLKPGNVYLSTDGTAKVGDFGLAVAPEHSRLTRSGIALGTVSYMPPEQAMGLEVTPKADLYSLGAVVYEMLTGRPPFIGDGAVAVASQHVNTPPVSPSRYRPDTPPALDALILKLLEKDPARRPASATEVRQALETILPEGAGTAPAALSLTALPLYRRAFVGRHSELKELQLAFHDAVHGNGVLMTLVGDPGIGKTSLCQQLVTYATLRGGKALTGHCHEEGAAPLPYMAFTEALSSYAQSCEAERLRKEVANGAGDVARIVPEIKTRLKVRLRPSGNPEEARYRLMEAVAHFLGNAASSQPLLLVLEDLHDADNGTLQMLTHVSRRLGGTRLMILCTYRGIALGPDHPLSRTLADLSRQETYRSIALTGLGTGEVKLMLENVAGHDVAPGFASALCRHTSGNPLFVQEVTRYLGEQGYFDRGKALPELVNMTDIGMKIPTGLWDVINKRLSRLSPECNRVLSIAAVVGRDFQLDVLQELSHMPGETLFDALEEAKNAAIVEEHASVGATVHYRFAHSSFRQALYQRTIAPRRNRLHQEVARVLETMFKTRLEEHAADLAEHFSHSGIPADLAKAVAYSETAARQAERVYAYEESTRLLAQALRLEETLDPDNQAKQFDLVVALGQALINAGEPLHVLQIEAPRAWSLAEAVHDSARASMACQLAMWALFFHAPGGAWTGAEAALWAQRADGCAGVNNIARARADAALGAVNCANDRLHEGVSLLSRALELSRKLDDPDTLWWTSSLWLLYASGAHRVRDQLRLAEDLASRSHKNVSMGVLIWTMVMTTHTFLAWGQRRRAEEIWRETQGLIERSGQALYLAFSRLGDALFATMDGNLESAVEMVSRVGAQGKELGFTEFARFTTFPIVFRPLLHLGKATDALNWVSPRESAAGAAGLAHLARYDELAARSASLASTGRYDEAASILKMLVATRPEIGLVVEEVSVSHDMLLLEAAVLVGRGGVTPSGVAEDISRLVASLLDRLSKSGVRATGMFHATCVARHLGAAAAFLGRLDEARAYFKTAIQVATEMRFRPEIALARAELAEILIDHYPDQNAEALAHLDFAIAEFRDMKMDPALRQALRLRRAG